MNFKLEVVLTASPELLAALAALTGTRTQTTETKVAQPAKLKKAVETPADETDKEASTKSTSTQPSNTTAQNGQTQGTHTLESLRAIAVPKSKAGKKDEIKAWLSEAGYASLQDLQEKDFVSFHTFIEKL